MAFAVRCTCCISEATDASDEECCDGSDEWASPGLCPDRCQEIGDEYRKEQAALLKIRKTVGLVYSFLLTISGLQDSLDVHQVCSS